MTKSIALDEAQSQKHHEILLNLLDTRGKLMLVDPNSLTLDQHIEWNRQMFEVGNAIIAMEGVILSSISEAYAKAIPKIERATERLERDLHSLKKANDIIAAVGSALGIVTSIVKLIG